MTTRSLAAPAWALLALFVVYASSGTWTVTGRRIWAPLYLSWPDVAQNLLLYLPFGILGVLALRHRRQALSGSVLEVGIIAVLFSLFVELIQLFTSDRTASLVDLVSAVLGAVAGGVVAGPVASAADRAVEAVRPSGVFDAADAPVLVALCAALPIAAWWPFEPTFDISTMADRLRHVRRDPWQNDGVAAMAGHALLYMWLALAIAACAHRLLRFQAMFAATAAAGTMAVVLDVGQLAMASQPIGLAGLAAQLAGAMFGAASFAILRDPK